MAKPKYKLDIFSVLGNISKKNTKYYSNLSDEEKKGILPIVLMRWMTGTTSERQIYFINELVNPFVFSLHNHKELLVQLLTICAPGKSKRYIWKKAPSNKTTATPETVKIIKQYYSYNSRDAIDAIPLLSKEDILELADELGVQKDIITKIKKELRKK